MTPSLYNSLSDDFSAAIASAGSCVKYVVLGGEPFPAMPPASLSSPATSFYNVYGVTEMSCWQTLTKVENNCPGIEESLLFNQC
jgi:acyl-CoA synthetase